MGQPEVSEITRRALKNTAQLEAFQRRMKAVRLRASGATYEQIAQAIGYGDKSSARQAVMAVLKAHYDETAPDRNTLLLRELMTLDTLQMAAWKGAMSGDPESIRVVVRIMERRSRMLGIDAPTKIEITDELDREIASLTATMAEDASWDVDDISSDPDPMLAVSDGSATGGDPD